jgi:drug/metabolite transporter (DMT)-like permease
MTEMNYGLVVLSAVLLAVANLLVKRSAGSQESVGLVKVVEGVLLLPLLVAGAAGNLGSSDTAWPLPVVGAALVLMSNVLLASASRHRDLSLMVPASRGALIGALLLVGYLFAGQTVSATGGAGMVVILVGVACLPLREFSAGGVSTYRGALGAPATRHALLAGLVAAGATLWDQRSVQVLSPMAYLAGYAAIVGIVHALVLRQSGLGAALIEWRRSWRTIVVVAALGTGSTLLVLMALQAENAGYVMALRQISVALGAALGTRWLGEALAPPAITGIGLVLAGCVLLAMAG